MATTGWTVEPYWNPKKVTEENIAPMALKRSCCSSLQCWNMWVKLINESFWGFIWFAYIFEPRSQKIVPNIRDMKIVKLNLTAVYEVFRQYDQCCFQRQAMHWVRNGWEYCVGKYKSFVPGWGTLSSLIRALFLLQICTKSKIISFSFNLSFISCNMEFYQHV